MMKSIFSFEWARWINKPLFYIYAVLLAGLGALLMASNGGLFDSNTSTVSGLTKINSPLPLAMTIGSMTAFAFFLLPSIVGEVIHKDFKTRTFKLLYSFPFQKRDYVFGKFFAGFLVASILMVLLGLGMHIGTQFPGVDQNLVVGFDAKAYVQIYGLFVIPNLFLFSAIVFGVVLFTRSIIAGFIAIAALFFGQSMADVWLNNMDYKLVGAYLDPFGFNAINYYSKYWTITEQNENLLPMGSVVMGNRILWIAISILIFALTYLKFDFHSEPISLNFWKKKETTKSVSFRPSLIQKIALPKVSYKTNFLSGLQSAWALSKIDLKYVLRGGPFIVVSILGILFIIILVAFGSQIYQTDTLPVTRQILEVPGATFSMFITLLSFIYTGLLMHRSETVGVYQLEDATSTKTWSFMLSKMMSLVIMQMVLLAIIMVTGIVLQVYNGYYNFELDLYLFDLYGVKLINYVIWVLLGFFIFALIPNFFLGLFVCLLISIGITFLDRVGIEQSIYKYNQGPGTRYSDMSGYGYTLIRYYIYKFYWLFLGVFLTLSSYLFWRRGVRLSVREMFARVGGRFNWRLGLGMVLPLILFFVLGSWIYNETNVKDEFVSSKESERRSIDREKLYKRFDGRAQPRITDSNLWIDMDTEHSNISGHGIYQLVNKTSDAVDTIYIGYDELTPEIKLDAEYEVVQDDVQEVMLMGLTYPMMPGDTLALTFEIKNKPNTLLRNHSPVRENGTFFNNSVFPSIGYNPQYELTDDKTRKRYGLEPRERMPAPTDTAALANSYISNDADWINLMTTISTAPDQIAMSPGQLQKEWVKDGKRYFQYEMQSKTLNFYSFLSARYEKYEDNWNDIPITIYYHKGHDVNLERMMQGAQKALAYCSENFSPYQHRQLRILEFPIVGGGFAQSFANTVPFSEGIGFIADVDDEKDGVDYPFSVTAHEVAHQWWGHQVVGAGVQGATVMSESLSEYTSLKVTERERGVHQMRTFLKDALDRYLIGRTMERKKEQPLAYVENQQHIHYNKGSLVFYALSDYIGEAQLNAALSKYVRDKGFQEAPYTTTLELLDYLYEATPDSLRYFVEDAFEHITMYTNRIMDNEYRQLPDGRYEVKISAEVSKYRADEQGRRVYKSPQGDSLAVVIVGQKRPTLSYPLADFIEVGVFATNDNGDEEVLYLQKHKITEIQNEFTIIVDQEPTEVGIDPYNKLIDTNSEDNRRAAVKAK